MAFPLSRSLLFLQVTLTVDGHEYPSVEHYYQACKLYTLGGARLAAQLRQIPDAGQVKVYTKKLLRQASVPLEKVNFVVLLVRPFLSFYLLSLN